MTASLQRIRWLAGGTAFMREKEYFDTLCNTADGVFIVDANKRILRWNKGAEKILGFPENDVLDRECYRVIPGKSRADKVVCSQNCKIHTSALRGSPVRNFDVLTQSSEGKHVWLNVSIIAPPDGSDPFVAHILRDITPEKMRELAVNQFLADLEASSSMPKESFAEKASPKYSPAAGYPSPEKTTSAALSDREIEVLTLLAEGLSTKNLAQKLSISHFTARNHIQNILVKLGLHSKAQAVSYAFKKGIL
jgi:PAS domain S-box-containing protein